MRIHTYTAAETGLLVNSYLLETDGGVVAIDTNLLNSDIAALKARLAALKKPLLAIFVTHAHPDHFNGVLELVRERELPVYATVGVDRAIATSPTPSAPSGRPFTARSGHPKPSLRRLCFQNGRLSRSMDCPSPGARWAR